MNDRKSLNQQLEAAVLTYADLPVEEIVNKSEVRDLLERKCPPTRAAVLQYHQIVRSIIASKRMADGTREFLSVTQGTFELEVEEEPIVREGRVYVPAALATKQQLVDSMNYRRRKMLGILRTETGLPEKARLEIFACIDSGYQQAIEALG